MKTPTKGGKAKLQTKLDKDEVKARSSELYERVLQYDASGKPLCPLHDDKTSGNISITDDLWHCHVCKKGGDILTLIAERDRENIKTKDGMRAVLATCSELLGNPPVPAKVSRSVPAKSDTEKQEYIEAAYEKLWDEGSNTSNQKKRADWCTTHGEGIDDAVLDANGIVWGKYKAGKATKSFDSEGVIIPVKDASGKPIALRTLIDEKKMKAGWVLGCEGEVSILDKQKLSRADTVIFTEGEKDALAVESINRNPHALASIDYKYKHDGVLVSTTVTGGSGQLKDADAKLFAGKTVYIVQDSDDAGKNGSVSIADAILRNAPDANVYVCDIVGGAEQSASVDEKKHASETKGYDIRDFLVEGGNLNHVLATAKEATMTKPVPVDELVGKKGGRVQEKTIKPTIKMLVASMLDQFPFMHFIYTEPVGGIRNAASYMNVAEYEEYRKENPVNFGYPEEYDLSIIDRWCRVHQDGKVHIIDGGDEKTGEVSEHADLASLEQEVFDTMYFLATKKTTSNRSVPYETFSQFIRDHHRFTRKEKRHYFIAEQILDTHRLVEHGKSFSEVRELIAPAIRAQLYNDDGTVREGGLKKVQDEMASLVRKAAEIFESNVSCLKTGLCTQEHVIAQFEYYVLLHITRPYTHEGNERGNAFAFYGEGEVGKTVLSKFLTPNGTHRITSGTFAEHHFFNSIDEETFKNEKNRKEALENVIASEVNDAVMALKLLKQILGKLYSTKLRSSYGKKAMKSYQSTVVSFTNNIEEKDVSLYNDIAVRSRLHPFYILAPFNVPNLAKQLHGDDEKGEWIMPRLLVLLNEYFTAGGEPLTFILEAKPKLLTEDWQYEYRADIVNEKFDQYGKAVKSIKNAVEKEVRKLERDLGQPFSIARGELYQAVCNLIEKKLDSTGTSDNGSISDIAGAILKKERGGLFIEKKVKGFRTYRSAEGDCIKLTPAQAKGLIEGLEKSLHGGQG